MRPPGYFVTHSVQIGQTVCGNNPDGKLHLALLVLMVYYPQHEEKNGEL